ncbi:NmrA family NAD(P)-binding protein [Mucilaginibacter flavus]|uniref:NmrA family NAD(P)-binding protein n=1 Tax=Mucilaginibacter flavus TaxID=931504 RepID=UPI0025B2B0DC|nr:NmrA family NAD(P)-binding protein [Mucilaginibacter flavus]MDN3584595.1 NmrA family NAD(P)-binding protein [Mucilaginibacter flavus]
MNSTILVAGATGNLGQKICRELLKRNAQVRAIVRSGSNKEIIEALEKDGVDVFEVDWSNQQELISACNGVHCIISAITGLHHVIVDAQLNLLNAAVAASVPRFIPSDFSCDFTLMPKGENRNFDFRKEFQQYLDSLPIKATSIFNGCFADILRYNTPLFNVPEKTIGYYDDKTDWEIDFTTMDNTAEFTAATAMDKSSPRFLRIASFRVSPEMLVDLSEKHKDQKFQLVSMGSMEEFSAFNKMQRATHPEGEQQLYPGWQQAQYLYSMFSIHHPALDNSRYTGINWEAVESYI